MSLQLLSNEIAHFLASEKPEVLCITGKWGVGKTYAWNTALKEVQAEKGLPLARYAYVSLFGQGSLDDVKNAIWENSVASQSVEATPRLRTH
jgi:hypothetical protein